MSLRPRLRRLDPLVKPEDDNSVSLRGVNDEAICLVLKSSRPSRYEWRDLVFTLPISRLISFARNDKGALEMTLGGLWFRVRMRARFAVVVVLELAMLAMPFVQVAEAAEYSNSKINGATLKNNISKTLSEGFSPQIPVAEAATPNTDIQKAFYRTSNGARSTIKFDYNELSGSYKYNSTVITDGGGFPEKVDYYTEINSQVTDETYKSSMVVKDSKILSVGYSFQNAPSDKLYQFYDTNNLKSYEQKHSVLFLTPPAIAIYFFVPNESITKYKEKFTSQIANKLILENKNNNININSEPASVSLTQVQKNELNTIIDSCSSKFIQPLSKQNPPELAKDVGNITAVEIKTWITNNKTSDVAHYHTYFSSDGTSVDIHLNDQSTISDFQELDAKYSLEQSLENLHKLPWYKNTEMAINATALVTTAVAGTLITAGGLSSLLASAAGEGATVGVTFFNNLKAASAGVGVGTTIVKDGGIAMLYKYLVKDKGAFVSNNEKNAFIELMDINYYILKNLEYHACVSNGIAKSDLFKNNPYPADGQWSSQSLANEMSIYDQAIAPAIRNSPADSNACGSRIDGDSYLGMREAICSISVFLTNISFQLFRFSTCFANKALISTLDIQSTVDEVTSWCRKPE